MRMEPLGISQQPRRQPPCFSGRTFTGIMSDQVLPPSVDLTTKVPSQLCVLKAQVQLPHSSVSGWLLQEGCSGLMPRLKNPVSVKLTIRVPFFSSQMPQSQLPVVWLQGITTDGLPQVLPPSL